MSTAKLRFKLGLQARELQALELPVEVRKHTLALVARTLSSQTVEVPPGSYYLSARLPGGQELSNTVEVAAGQEYEVLLRPDPDEPPLESWDSLTFARGYLAEGLEVSVRTLDESEGKLRAFSGNSLLGEIHQEDTSGWRMEGGGRGGVAFSHVVGKQRLQMVQLLQPGKPPLLMMLPAWGKTGCHLVVSRRAHGLALDIQLDHPGANLLLRYQEQGMLQQAVAKMAATGLDAEQLLGQTQDHPIAATVAAYALLRFGELDRLKSSSEKLMSRFGWLPDGLVVRAEHLARLGHHAAALGLLLGLSRRGLPLFSEGLSYALDRLHLYLGQGARHFERENLDKATPLLERLRHFASFTDFREPLLTYTALDPLVPTDAPLGSDLASYTGLDVSPHLAG